jgi:hypothetical protein
MRGVAFAVRMIICVQVLIAIVLVGAAIGMGAAASSMNGSMNNYMSAAAPYIDEISSRGMDMLRNVDGATVSVARMANATEAMLSQAHLEELRLVAMEAVQNVDAATTSVAQMMHDSEAVAAVAAPGLLQSMNQTAEMVTRVQQLVQNPTIKLSLS